MPAATASPWIVRFLEAVPPTARVLDFAAGTGRHATFAAAAGRTVTAVDRDVEPLRSVARNPAAGTIEAVAADLESGEWPFAAAAFDVVIVTRFLHRPRLALLPALLAPGGLLLYETFAQGQARHGRPSNPAFLLAPGELLALARGARLHVLAYEDGEDLAPVPARVQRIAALRAPVDLARHALRR